MSDLYAVVQTNHVWKPWMVVRWGPDGKTAHGRFWTKRAATRRAVELA
jgi:hypothetical protein